MNRNCYYPHGCGLRKGTCELYDPRECPNYTPPGWWRKLDKGLLLAVFYFFLMGVTMFLVCGTLFNKTYYFMPVKKLPGIADTESSNRLYWTIVFK